MCAGPAWGSTALRFTQIFNLELRRCVDNGRALQELLQEAAPRYVKALKRERANPSKSKKS